jgi:hypothetical protein
MTPLNFTNDDNQKQKEQPGCKKKIKFHVETPNFVKMQDKENRSRGSHYC